MLLERRSERNIGREKKGSRRKEDGKQRKKIRMTASKAGEWEVAAYRSHCSLEGNKVDGRVNSFNELETIEMLVVPSKTNRLGH